MSALPPVVVSGLPNITPIFMRIWLMKMTHGAAIGMVAGQLAQGLGHQAGLQTHLRVAHVALDLGARHQRRHGVDHQHVDRAGTHQRVGDLERLLAVVGLGDEEVVDALTPSLRA